MRVTRPKQKSRPAVWQDGTSFFSGLKCNGGHRGNGGLLCREV